MSAKQYVLLPNPCFCSLALQELVSTLSGFSARQTPCATSILGADTLKVLQAIKAVLPAFEVYVRDASKLHTPADEPSLLDEPSAPVKAVVHILSQVCSLH